MMKTILRMPIFLVAACSLCVFTGCLSWFQHTPKSRLKQGRQEDLYVNPVFHYSLPVPTGWILRENLSSAPSFVTFSRPGTNAWAKIIVSSLGTCDQEGAHSRWSDSLSKEERINRLRKQPADVELISVEESEAQGFPSLALDYLWSGKMWYGTERIDSENQLYRTVSLWILRVHRPVTIRCVAPSDEFDQLNKEYFQPAMEGIRLEAE